ncbi:tetratricopeptide repeat protein [Desulforapulum autotrophicum]|nr:tetratricopeptide repeat protein [Desulforapulum autotrophicum]
MQLGKSILSNLGWPDYTDFYFSPTNTVVNDLRYSWLGNVLLYLVHLLGGDVGLQLFRVGLVCGSCFLLSAIIGYRFTGWTLLAFFMLVVGTYQNQQLRNSIFALPLTVIVFWLWWQVQYRVRDKWIYFFPLILGLWGCIHGSYLFGFGLVVLIFLGHGVDVLRLGKASKGRAGLFGKYLIVLGLSFALISIWNPQAKGFYNLQKNQRLFHLDPVVDRQPVLLPLQTDPAGINGETVDGQKSPGIFTKLKVTLNNIIFSTTGPNPLSGDFISPFDMLQRVYVWVSLFVGLIGSVILLFFSRPIRFSHLLPFFAVVVAGCGYLRLVGYIPVVTLPLVFITFANGELKLHVKNGWASALAVILLVALYIDVATGFTIVPGTKMHIFGPGRVPVFSDKCPDRVMAEFPDKKIFTTIMNGGYLLYRWFPEKKVFIDGFFAPHTKEVFDAFYRIQFDKSYNPDSLFSEFGIEIALVPYSTPDINNKFLFSENWYPVYVDTGSFLYLYQPDFAKQVSVPRILTTAGEIENLPQEFRSRLVSCIYQIPHALMNKGRLKDANSFMAFHGELFKKIEYLADPMLVREVQDNLDINTGFYGNVNIRALWFEKLHFDAANQGNVPDVLKYGVHVLELAPDRCPVLLNLAIVHENQGELEKSGEYLERLLAAKEKDPAFWKKNETKIAKLYLNLYNSCKKKGKYPAAYLLLREPYLQESYGVQKEKLYQEGLKLVDEMNKAGDAAGAFKLLRGMEKDFPRSGRMLNEIAWHILSNRTKLSVDVKTAIDYATRAVKLMEKENDTWLDLAYDTLAEAYYCMNDRDKMRKFELKAIEVAPDERKGLYKHR